LDKNRLEIILAQAQANQEAAAREAAAAAELKAVQQAQGSTSKRRSEHEALGPRRKKGRVSNEEKKEKKLMKLVGEFVVKTMSKYQYMMDRETFKKHAKEVSRFSVYHCT
jgi:heme-binding NEAT domain protein